MKITYTAFDAQGKASAGTIEAASVDAARAQLRKQGLFVTRAGSASGAAAGGADGSRGGSVPGGGGAGIAGGGVGGASVPGGGGGGGLVGLVSGRSRMVSQFMRQAAVLVTTGTPMVEALAVLEKQATSQPWRLVLADVRTRVEEGAQFSDAMQRHPGWFDPVCRSLVAAGESRGNMGDMLKRAAELMRQQERARSAILGALAYPSLLICLAMGVMVALVGFVMPRFEGLFQTLGAGLPPTTKVLMSASHFLRAHWIETTVGVVVSLAALVWWLCTRRGQQGLQVVLVRLPMIGHVSRELTTARITRILGVLLDGRVALLDALVLAEAGAANVLYERLLRRARDLVTRGEPMSVAFDDSSLIHPSVCEAIRSGERTGQIGPVLSTLAEFLDEDNDAKLKTLASVIEPMILVVLGLLVGGVAMSMFLPLFDLAGGGAMGASGPGGGAGGAP